MSRSVLISALGLQACCQMPEFARVLFWGCGGDGEWVRETGVFVGLLSEPDSGMPFD